ncbi:Glucose-1,6-bisphosphate synthase [Segniliparus rotundus DSM 44985]|uniref:Glucose-1,6-bisphosphate synthase n=1 Tax=Segniliparus rotundus (strain ATCC BAA-972 / CDC 1076 / CIP 108378 / DSM 44985 / JCM 13578) TaxID=640132 RepID=D6ZCD2_SEGRD|nr:phospho-sugar mutase [Segniliparus rotundus]ADG99101.1 Glucose-1,6-bisphosphate synthase [Segniliparus rotundus DSM 44985]
MGEQRGAPLAGAVRELAAQVEAWIEADPDPGDRDELRALLAAQAWDELADRFAAPLAFGTAGLRGQMRAGPNGMNLAVVVRASRGLADWLVEQGLQGETVVVGCDARHRSAQFAQAAAEVFAAAGFDVLALPSSLPTPVTAFIVKWWCAAAGVQITASHNPPQDNGYKVYVSDGAQLLPPLDREIEAALAATAPANQVPRSALVPKPHVDDAVQTYLDRVGAVGHSSARAARIALTPMHGVGGNIAVEALRRAGFEDVHVVAEQFEPDPDFPTAPFPNPEEPGATDLLLALAARVGADLAVALDPDADRLALGVPSDGGWRMLTGDEAGVLLGGWVLDNSPTEDPITASTVVSSRQLQALAEARLTRHVRTLTGFKWLVRAGEGLPGTLVYAYEEAIGHCVDPDAVRDKDGISAAVLAADLVADLKARGRTVQQVLDEYAVELGVYATRQVSLRFPHLGGISAAMAKLRAEPPAELRGEPARFEDLARPARGPSTDAVVMTSDSLRVVVRPSGTEPKLKIYLEATEPVPDAAALPGARAAAERQLDGLADWAHSLLNS